MMCLFGGLSSLLAQTTVTIDGTVGSWDKNANANIPVCANNTYTTSQQIYFKEELGLNANTSITSVGFNAKIINSAATNKTRKIRIYMANTTADGFPDKKLIKMDESDLVYEGNFTIDVINSYITINFNKKNFTYTGGNILLCVWDYTGTKAGGAISFNTYKGNNKDSNNKLIIRNIYKTAVNIDPTLTSTLTFSTPSSTYNALPQVQFGYIAGGVTTEKPVFSNIPSYYYPTNGSTDIFNPHFQFVATNTTNYKILLSKSDDFSNVQYIKGSADAWATKDSDVKTVTTEQFSNLDAGTTYYWKVKAKNVDLNGESDEVESDIFIFTTKAIEAKPDELESCSPTNGTVCYDGYPTLSWTYGDNTSQYKVLFGTSKKLKDDTDAEGNYIANNNIVQNWTTANLASGDSYQTSGLIADSTYYWRVDVKNSAGTTEGEVHSFTIPGVKNISNAEASDGKLTWTFDEYATEYRVLLSKPTNNKNPLEERCNYLIEANYSTGWLSVPEDKQGSYTLPTTLEAGVEYCWTVEVRNFADDKIYDNYVYEKDKDDEGKTDKVFKPEVDIYRFVTSSMSPVDNTSPKNEEKDLNNPMLKWSFNGSSATYYQVYFGADADSLEAQGWMEREKVKIDSVEEYKANGSFQTSDLTANTTYYWRVDVTDAEDPTAEGISVYKGDTWSFLSHLPAPEPSANPTQIKPEYAIVYGGTTISWNILNGVTGYNVYLDGTKDENKLNLELLGANQNYYTIYPEDKKLKYNMKDEKGNGGYDIYVEAVYGTTTKKSEAVNVTVTGVGFLSVDVVDETTTTKKYVEGATITLTQIEDEWGNTEDLNVSYTFITDENGQYLSSKEGNERPLAGTYKISVEKDDYTQKLAEDESDEIVITYNEITTKKLTLVLNIPDNVTPVTPINEAEGVTDQTIEWEFAEGTDDYRFFFGKSLIGLEQLCDWTAVGENKRMEFKLSGLEANTTYYWAVDVRNELGARQAFGDNAAAVETYSFTTNETLPVFNTAPANGATNLTNPTLKWKYNGNATSYMVRLGESEDALTPYPDGDWKTRGEEETGSLTTASLKERTKYYWRVDVLDANDNAYIGDVWSFVSTLPAPVATATPTQIVPSLSGTYGKTTISWYALEGVTGYNVYLGTEKLNEETLSADTTYTIDAETLKLKYNMGNGYDIYVEAVYELGNSMSEAVNVKVTGSGFLNANIKKSFNTDLGVDGATITLTQLEDEFENVYEENGKTYTFTTDDNGTIENQRVLNGKYAVEVSRNYYETHKDTITFAQNKTTELKVNLKANSEYVFEVSTNKNTFNSIHIYLENSEWGTAQSGNYNVYLKNGEEVTMLGNYYFAPTAAGNEGVTSVYFIYEGWADLSKGSYQFGVAKTEYQINWSETVTRNYDIFDGEDTDWNDEESWKDGEVPSNDANVHISGSVIINKDDDVTVATVTIENGGKLTINGSLTADKVVNNANAESLIINDGAQLRQTGNTDLSGVFNMNIKPTDWANAEEGWQFISSPFANAKVEALTNDGNYDFYRYDGEADLEWINHKQGGFETVFTSGVGYLASHETLGMVTLSGTLNNAVSHTWEFTYKEGKDLANFHLLGNPFTFNMDMSAATYTHLVEGVAIVNAEGGYTYVGADQETTTIPVGDGFFVKANAENATDVIKLSYGTRSSREKSANINLVATSKAGKDNVVISFSGKKEGFDKLQNFNEEIATVCVAENGKAYGIYNCESDVNEIAVMFSAKQMDSYSLSFELNGEFESAVLVDRLTGIETDMTAESEYNFIATSDDMKNRFVVRLGDGQATTDEANFVYQSGDELIIDAEGAIEIIDMMGRVVYRSEMNDGRVNVSEFNNAAYVVRALNAGKVQKVVIY